MVLKNAHTQALESITQIKYHPKYRVFLLKVAVCFLICSPVALLFWYLSRYNVSDEMQVSLKEFSNVEYPANPAQFSQRFKSYSQRNLKVVKKDGNRFDFILKPTDKRTATITLKNVDGRLLVPRLPSKIKGDNALEAIYFTEREFSRQQVNFSAHSENVDISGGDGFEKANLHSIDLANNCLNAGYWEIILNTKEKDKKSVYYQAWFTFPMGMYKDVFEHENNTSYWPHHWRLEHWQDPAGKKVNLERLRTIVDEPKISVNFPLDEEIIVSGEQGRKIRTLYANNLVTWRDFYDDKRSIQFATFQPPGWYNHEKPWGNEYWRIGKFEGASLRNIQPVGQSKTLQEIELVFSDIKTGDKNRFLISGINIKDLPHLPVDKYPDGLYMPMGLSVPPFFQGYEKLQAQPSHESPYFSVLLDSQGQWIDHHKVAVDGSVMHLDKSKPNLLHLYLLSYERHTLIAHFLIQLS
jgi:hypothetical protein